MYPVLTMRDRGAFANGEGLFVKYIIKPQPRTRSPEYHMQIPASPDFRICHFAISHVGENFPCAHKVCNCDGNELKTKQSNSFNLEC